MKTNTLHFSGSDMFIAADELDAALLADLLDCSAPGSADEAVAYVLSAYTVTGDPADCRAMLKGYGAWDDEELADHDENLARLVWLTGCGLAEDEREVYFSTS